MKKCPACRSIGPDNETKCGVCGGSLQNVAPMTETLEQSNLEDRLADSAEEREFARNEAEVDLVKFSVGLSVGLVFLFSGMILIIYEGFGSLGWLVSGFLFLPLGLWVVASVALRGLGPSAWHRLWIFRVFLLRWNLIGSQGAEDEDRREENEKAENAEARVEDDKSRRERERTGFD